MPLKISRQPEPPKPAPKPVAKQPAPKAEPPKDSPLLLRLLRAGVREDFAQRAIRPYDEVDADGNHGKGITDNDINWNEVLGRPANFVEGDKDEEAKRRNDFLRIHPEVKLKP